MTGMSVTSGSSSPRVPMALQQVFIASQRGDDVAKIQAPRSPGIGFKVFKRAFGGFRTKANQKALKKQQLQLQRAPSLSSLNSETSRNKTTTTTTTTSGGGGGGGGGTTATTTTTTTKKGEAPKTKMARDDDATTAASSSQPPAAAARPTAADATRFAMKEKPLTVVRDSSVIVVIVVVSFLDFVVSSVANISLSR
jgi:hypothetical protein